LLKSDSKAYAGHNPLGGWSVLALLLLIALQAISGLFVSDEIFSEGPYRSLTSQGVIEVMEFIHFNLFNLLLGVVALHLIAVIFYQFYKRQPLINAMLHGKKSTDAQGVDKQKLLVGLAVASFVAVIVYLVVAVFPPQPDFYY
jgi:cytochrome b